MLRNLALCISLGFFLWSCVLWESEDEDRVVEHMSILALGDSLTAWYGVSEESSYPSQLENKLIMDEYDVSLINAGVSWDTSWDLLARAENYLEPKPDIVIIVIGWNDGLRGLPVVDMQSNIQATIDLYQWDGTTIVLWWMDILPIYGFWYRSDFKDVYKNIAAENSEIYFLSSFLSGVAARVEYNQSDNIHPNAEWYDIISENVFKFLVKNKLVEK